MAAPFYSPTSRVQGLHFPHPHQHLLLVVFFIAASLVREVTLKREYCVIFELTDHSTEHSEKQQGTLTASDCNVERSLHGVGFGEWRPVP